ncbi:hypothetical protein V8C44DRAFT_120548 [Trichoderma aethiopicum]
MMSNEAGLSLRRAHFVSTYMICIQQPNSRDIHHKRIQRASRLSIHPLKRKAVAHARLSRPLWSLSPPFLASLVTIKHALFSWFCWVKDDRRMYVASHVCVYVCVVFCVYQFMQSLFSLFYPFAGASPLSFVSGWFPFLL